MAEIIDNLKVGIFIKALLKEHRMTQDDLANELHITKAAVSQNLNGKNSFDIENLVRIAKLFKISLDDLIAARKPIDQPDIDSEYIRMMKRGFEDFKQHQPKTLNIGIPDVYGKLFMEYLIENARHDWIEYIADQGIIYADLNHQSYSMVSQKLVIYLLKNKLKHSEKIIESFAHKFGQFRFDKTHDREEFMVLLSQNQSYELFEKLLVGNIKFMTTKSILYFNVKWTDLNPIYNRKILIEDVIRHKLFDLWKIIVNLILKHQSFAFNEKYFLMLSEAEFIEGLNYFIQTIPAANRLETYGSVPVSKAMGCLIKSQQGTILLNAIKKQFVYDMNDLFSFITQYQAMNLAEELVVNYPQLIKPKKIAILLSKALQFEFMEKHASIFTTDVLSYTLDHLTLSDANRDVLNGLIKIGASFNSIYTNANSAEKMNRILTKIKKGKN